MKEIKGIQIMIIECNSDNKEIYQTSLSPIFIDGCKPATHYAEEWMEKNLTDSKKYIVEGKIYPMYRVKEVQILMECSG